MMLIATCSKKDDPVASNSLYATWQLASESRVDCTDPLENAVEPCTTGCFTIAFTATEYTITIPGAGAYTGTYTVSGNSLTLNVAGQPTETFTYTVSGSTLTFTTSGGAYDCTEVTTFSKI